ncbi:MAG: leucyl/phenylalanyl-tRNA--protein transferase [Gammaproteobacteria bacterium]
MAELRWLEPTDPPEAFPSPALALRDPDGLLAAGGDLSAERLLAAYHRGIFPWFNEGQPILWWSPDPRAVLIPSELRISRSLRRTLNRDHLSVTVDQAFEAVIANCAESRADTGTWITPEMREAYLELYELGHAHSVETWQGTDLVGGLYGVNIGRAFAGESMFSAVSDASKVALVRLVRHCEALGIALIDCQLPTAHLTSLGSRSLPRAEFLGRLADLQSQPTSGPWAAGPLPTSELI